MSDGLINIPGFRDCYKNPRAPRLLAECKRFDCVPSKIWTPEGILFTAICATIEEIAGSLVVDGVPESEYWQMVAEGYRAKAKAAHELAKRRQEFEYRDGWIDRWLRDTRR